MGRRSPLVGMRCGDVMWACDVWMPHACSLPLSSGAVRKLLEATLESLPQSMLQVYAYALIRTGQTPQLWWRLDGTSADAEAAAVGGVGSGDGTDALLSVPSMSSVPLHTPSVELLAYSLGLSLCNLAYCWLEVPFALPPRHVPCPAAKPRQAAAMPCCHALPLCQMALPLAPRMHCLRLSLLARRPRAHSPRRCIGWPWRPASPSRST